MKKHAVELLLVFSCFMLFTGGCATKEMVKIDPPSAPGADASGQAKVEPVRTEQVKAEPPLQQSLTQAPLQESAAEQTLEPASQAGELGKALDSIYFGFDRSDLSPEARGILVKNAERLKQGQGQKVLIAGHCDERGSDDYNLALSERRAKAALQYLVSLGVPAESLSVIGYGKEKPAAPGHDAASWALNRRDDFEILAQ